MKKEELAEQYLQELYGNYGSLADRNQSKIDFLAGWEAGQPKWINVEEQTPPKHIELLVKDPNGLVHISSWRESYNIFACQNKSESSYDWQWMEIPQ